MTSYDVTNKFSRWTWYFQRKLYFYELPCILLFLFFYIYRTTFVLIFLICLWLPDTNQTNPSSVLCFNMYRFELETFWQQIVKTWLFHIHRVFLQHWQLWFAAFCRFLQDPMHILQTLVNYSLRVPWIHMLTTLMLLTRRC